MVSHTRVVGLFALVLVVVLAGCGGAGGGADGGSAGSGAGGVNASSGSVGGASGAAGAAEGASGSDSEAGNQQALQASQAIVKTGHVRLGIENFSAAQRNLTEATSAAGGYVGASSQTTNTENGANVTRGELVLRVPSRNFSVLFAEVKAAGTVHDARNNTTDVSGRLVDLRARLNNSRAQRERLRGLYANASDTEATLAVQQRLSGVQSRIERLEGQLASLNGQVAYSTITVELAESAPEASREQWYDVGVGDALVSSVGGVLTTLRALVVGVAYLAPYLVVFGVPVGLVGYVVHRRRGA